MAPNPIQQFTDAVNQSLSNGSFVKMSLGGYRGQESHLQKLLARRIMVKKAEKLSFTYRYKTRDMVKNYDPEEAVRRIHDYLRDFHSASLMTTEFDLQWDGRKLKKTAPTQTAPTSLEHNRSKRRPIPGDKPYLHTLGITDATGNVNPTAQDKYRQINKYIETLSSLVSKLPKKDKLRVVDMGAGKGYLTFALYDYLQHAGWNPQVTGVEFRADLVVLCNRIAKESNFTGLKFVEGAIDGFDAKETDILIALHACDTATDDAIAKGIHANADIIVVAPCCHKQIRKQMDAASQAPDLQFILKHGIYMERQAEMVTDGIRALLLELQGYRTNLFEFISESHTPKNIMITAVRGTMPNASRKTALQEELARAKQQFGIRQHYLETLLS